MPTYNGHRTWNHWNVALWLSNDEGLCLTARTALRRHRSARAAAVALLDELPSHTPDGARYTVTSLTAALRGLES